MNVLQALAPDREAPLFPAKDPNRPLDGASFYRRWARVLKAAGVKYRKPHALRHSFASTLLSRNAPLLYVVRAGGWSNGTTLLRVYSKWIDEAADAASMATSSWSNP